MSETRRTQYRRHACLVLAGMGCTGTVQAHLDATGLGPFYDGLLHFLTSPEDLVPVVAIAFLAGLGGPGFSRRLVCLLPVCWFIGSALGMSVLTPLEIGPIGSGVTFILLGGLVVMDLKYPLWLLTVLVALLGGVHGFINGTGVGWSWPGAVALLGVASTAFGLSVLLAAMITQLRAGWPRIAVRVAGSWITASGLLILGWSLR